jgi:hypothetical protein
MPLLCFMGEGNFICFGTKGRSVPYISMPLDGPVYVSFLFYFGDDGITTG